MAAYNAIRRVFPRSKVLFCTFHLLKAIKENIVKIFGVSFNTLDEVPAQIWHICKKIPYFPWNPELTEVLRAEIIQISRRFKLLTKEERTQTYDDENSTQEECNEKWERRELAKKRHAQTKTFIKYLFDGPRSFMSEKSVFGYKNWDYSSHGKFFIFSIFSIFWHFYLIFHTKFYFRTKRGSNKQWKRKFQSNFQ